MSFKIVDTFLGARGGSECFFGIFDEDRDRRRFDTYDDAKRALETDRLNVGEEAAPSNLARPPEDQWGRRFMKLAPVASDLKWCLNVEDERWSWQEAYDFEFWGPVLAERPRYSVSLRRQSLGQVEQDSSRPYSWKAEREGSSIGPFISAYHAACGLLKLSNEPPKPKRKSKKKGG